MFPEKLHMTISLHKKGVFAKFPSRSFFCYLAREIFLPREGNHFCYFDDFNYFGEICIEISLHAELSPHHNKENYTKWWMLCLILNQG